jgi:hypothetical protein
MKVVIKILFFILAMFSANICEAKVFSEVVTQIRFIENAIENKNEVTINLENDIAITCKSQSDLLVYRNWAKGCEANAAKGGTAVLGVGLFIFSPLLMHASLLMLLHLFLQTKQSTAPKPTTASAMCGTIP